MPIRSIKPTFFYDEKFVQLERRAGLPPRSLRLFFVGLWVQADRNGVFPWSPLWLQREIVPWDDDVDVEAVLEALVAGGQVARFEADGERYGVITKFLRHQIPRSREAARYPEPPPDLLPADVRDKIRGSERSGSNRSVQDPWNGGQCRPRGLPIVMDRHGSNSEDPDRRRHPDVVERARIERGDDDDNPNEIGLKEIARLYRAAFGREPPDLWLHMIGRRILAENRPDEIRAAFEAAAEYGARSPRYVEVTAQDLSRRRRQSAAPSPAPPADAAVARPDWWDDAPVCEECGGTGEHDGICGGCDGLGRLAVRCTQCRGTGHLVDQRCGECGGFGYLPLPSDPPMEATR